jgi:phage shock protein A
MQAVRKEQDTLLSTCAQQQSCDQVYFTRAMVLLFQNREEAATSFQQAMAAAPNGPFADPSALWIRFLAKRSSSPTSNDEPSEALLEVMKGTARAWLERPRAAVGTAKSATTETVKALDPSVHNLQLQIRTRDKRIAELTDQLEALKQIDLDSSGANKLPRPRKSAK